ncbi:MAG: hypothetical protein ACI9HB_001871, partial [Gammaproteobacteria bacterium]
MATRLDAFQRFTAKVIYGIWGHTYNLPTEGPDI